METQPIETSETRNRGNVTTDRDVRERCIMGPSVPLFPQPFDQRVQIVQTPYHVAIKDEEGDLHLIPVTNQTPMPDSIRQWAGRSRGHWEGDRSRSG